MLGLTINPNYTLTEHDLLYLKSVNLQYHKQKHLIYIVDASTSFMIERGKNNIRKIPNRDFYCNLNDDFKYY